jgi:hypothetical protein
MTQREAMKGEHIHTILMEIVVRVPDDGCPQKEVVAEVQCLHHNRSKNPSCQVATTSAKLRMTKARWHLHAHPQRAAQGDHHSFNNNPPI